MSPNSNATLNRMRALAVLSISMSLAMSPSIVRADATAASPRLAVLAQPAVDDARKAVALGPAGEVYEPDGNGAWVQKQRISTSDQISQVGRAAGAIIAFGEGIVYRLAPNGWSAIRLHQKERAVMSAGVRAVAAVGRQLFALDQSAGGEPLKLAIAPSNVLAIGTGAAVAGTGPITGGVVIQTDRGLFKLQGARPVAITNAPQRVNRLLSDRWVLVDDGAIDLKTGRKSGWPPGVVVGAAAAMADERLVIVAKQQGKLELVTISKDKLDRAPIEADGSLPSTAIPVGVVVDRSGRAVIAFDDGTLLVRGSDKGTWAVVRVSVDLGGPKPGSPPAVSP